MIKIVSGAVLVFALQMGAINMGFAASGDGLDGDAAATGNSTFAGQHRRPGSRAVRSRGRMLGVDRRHRHLPYRR